MRVHYLYQQGMERLQLLVWKEYQIRKASMKMSSAKNIAILRIIWRSKHYYPTNLMKQNFRISLISYLRTLFKMFDYLLLLIEINDNNMFSNKEDGILLFLWGISCVVNDFLQWDDIFEGVLCGLLLFGTQGLICK